jgi:hypothetical protein
MTVHPPVGKQKRYPPLSLTVIHAHERGAPEGREPIRWHLLTDLPVGDLAAAVEKLDWYALRWKLETYHKVLKSGCQAERARLRTAERLTNLLAVLCVVGWRVFWLTMVNRATPDAPAESVLTKPEVELLDRLAARAPPTGKPRAAKRTVSHYLVQIAKLGGYLARAQDPPPGNLVIWPRPDAYGDGAVPRGRAGRAGPPRREEMGPARQADNKASPATTVPAAALR